MLSFHVSLETVLVYLLGTCGRNFVGVMGWKVVTIIKKKALFYHLGTLFIIVR